MDLLPEPRKTINRLMYEATEKDARDWRRPHLGASSIGHECLRKLWYDFRWCSEPDHSANLTAQKMKEAWFEEDCAPGRLQRLFATGDRIEASTVESLVAAGLTVWAVNPNTGEQDTVSWGHFGGSTDGSVQNTLGFTVDIRFVQPADKEEGWYPWKPGECLLLEVKSYNRLRFQKLRRDGVFLSDEKYYDQVQVYLHGLITQRGAPLAGCLFIATCKDDDRVEAQYIPYVPAHAEGLVEKGVGITTTDSIPARAWEDESARDAWPCKFCDHQPTCRSGRLPVRSCRTCVSAQATEDGRWLCHKDTDPVELTWQDQTADAPLACQRYLPALVPGEAVDASEDPRWISYDIRDGSHWVDRGPEWAQRPDGRIEELASAVSGFAVTGTIVDGELIEDDPMRGSP